MQALVALQASEWDKVFKQVFTIVTQKVQLTKKRRLARPEEKSYSTVFDWLTETSKHQALGQVSANAAV